MYLKVHILTIGLFIIKKLSGAFVGCFAPLLKFHCGIIVLMLAINVPFKKVSKKGNYNNLSLYFVHVFQFSDHIGQCFVYQRTE